MMGEVRLVAVVGVPEVRPGDDLGALLAVALAPFGRHAGDIVCVAQKVVSKAEGRVVPLADVRPSARARRLAADTDLDPRKVEVVLGESKRIVRHRSGLIVAEHRLGFVMANAGVDESNAEPGTVLLLPCDPDESARRLHAALHVPAIVTDTFGRPHRRGLVDVAIGVAGLPAILDLRGTPDARGRPLRSTMMALADQVAAAAGLLMGKADRVPAVLVRGVRFGGAPGRAVEIVRPEEEDLFR